MKLTLEDLKVIFLERVWAEIFSDFSEIDLNSHNSFVDSSLLLNWVLNFVPWDKWSFSINLDVRWKSYTLWWNFKDEQIKEYAKKWLWNWFKLFSESNEWLLNLHKFIYSYKNSELEWVFQDFDETDWMVAVLNDWLWWEWDLDLLASQAEEFIEEAISFAEDELAKEEKENNWKTIFWFSFWQRKEEKLEKLLSNSFDWKEFHETVETISVNNRWQVSIVYWNWETKELEDAWSKTTNVTNALVEFILWKANQYMKWKDIYEEIYLTWFDWTDFFWKTLYLVWNHKTWEEKWDWIKINWFDFFAIVSLEQWLVDRTRLVWWISTFILWVWKFSIKK